MKAYVSRWVNNSGHTIEKYEIDDVIFTIGDFPEEMPEIAITIPYCKTKTQSLTFSLKLKDLEDALSLSKNLKWLKDKNRVK